VVEAIHDGLAPCFLRNQRAIVLGEHRMIGRYGLKRLGPFWFESMLG